MKTQIYSVYDMAAKAYLPPFYSVNDDTALRSFASAVQDTNHNFSRHAADYTLFNIGVFDDEQGDITPLQPHSKLATALQYVNKPAISNGELTMTKAEIAEYVKSFNESEEATA